MIGRDILINRELTEDQIRAAAAAALEVSPGVIYIFDGDAGPPTNDEDGTIVTIMHVATSGDFVMLLSTDPRTPETAAKAQPMDPVAIAQRFCEIATVDVIIDDGSIDPFSWLLLRPGAPATIVRFDADQLDAHRYVLARQPATAAD
jgi:hypothetical protein